MCKNKPTENNMTKTRFRYLLLTGVYVFLLFINLSGILPLGILLGVIPTTLLYIIALVLARKRTK